MWSKSFLILLVFLQFGCTNEDNSTVRDCEAVACTLNFVTLSVTVKDASGIKIPLDRFRVIVVDSGEDLTLDLDSNTYGNFSDSGFYPIFNDSYRSKYQNKSATIEFRGFIADKAVVTSQFKVGADCCHVLLLPGNTDIVLD
jgi:hypothetical protein